MNRSSTGRIRAAGAFLLLTAGSTAFAATALPPATAVQPSDATPVQAKSPDAQKVFPAVGVVTGKNPDGALTINHQPIEGLMPAMEMTFNVKPRALSSAVRPGDKIEFSVEGKTYTIVALKVVGHQR
jgi:Cu/Ag efflux protein CusF